MENTLINWSPEQSAVCRLVIAAHADGRVYIDIDFKNGDVAVYLHGVDAVILRETQITDIDGINAITQIIEKRSAVTS